MKILLVAPQPFYRERGTPIAVRLLVGELCRLGHEVDLLVYHDGEDISIPGMRLFRAGRPPGIDRVPIGISVAKLVCDLWLIVAMLRLLRERRYDVVHAVEEAVFPAALVHRRHGAHLVYDMDSSLADQLTEKWTVTRPLKGLLEWVERRFVRRASLVLAVCEDLAVKVRPWVGATRVVVLPDVPMGNASPEGSLESIRDAAPAGTVTGLYVGNLERYQGMDLLLEALSLLPPELPFRMVVIGGSPEHVGKYRAMAESLGISSRLSLLGARPVARLGDYLQQADILVSPRTLGQNTPMKVYSYMQAGKAIVATDIRSHTQALDASCAMLVPATPAGVAAGLASLLRDPALRERLGRAARERAETEYSLPVFQRKLEAAYRQLAGA
jgi:glycosyltransferase involved in cell wall biosynthesis